MNIKPKKYTNYVPRLPHWISNREGYYTMERNERVEDFTNQELKKLFSSITSFDLRTYPDTDEVYKNLSSWLKVKTNNVLIAEGADGGLLRIFNVFINGGDRVLALEPSFAMYPVYCQMFSAKYYPLKLKLDSKFNYFKILKEKIIKIKPKIISLANPNQPLEAMLSLKEIKAILNLSKKYNSLVVIDEAYAHFNKVNSIPLIKKFKNLVVVRTFSKSFGLAGMRIGYSVANEKLIGYMKSIKPIYEINGINIKIVNYFLKNIHIMRKHVDQIEKSRKFFKNFLNKYNIEMIGKYSNTVLFRLNSENHVKYIIREIYKKKFIIRPMVIDNDKRYIRCTLGNLKTMKYFVKNMKKLFDNKKYNSIKF